MKNLIALILIITAVAGFFLYVRPAYDEAQALEAEAERFDTALEEVQEMLALRDALLAKYNSLPSGQLNRLEKLLPDTVDNIRLILDIDGIAAEYGMVLQDISFSAPTLEENSGEGQEPTQSSIDFSFSVQSPYEDFLNFMADLENSLRLADVQSLGFTSSDTDTNQYRVTIRTYWLR